MLDTQQETIRAVNETIRECANDPRISSKEAWEFFCECGCFTRVVRSIEQFDDDGGVWASGHQPLLNAP